MAQPILGSFGKGVKGSISVNFGLSGGQNCDTDCQHHPDNSGRCYAATLERRPDRQNLAAKLARHEATDAAELCRHASLELWQMKTPPPWLRISTDGSVPKPADWSDGFRAAFRGLIKMAVSQNVPVHLPVESADKAAAYRQLVGDLVTVRQSAQSEADFVVLDGAVSTVGGIGLAGKNLRRRRVAASRQLARQREASTGRRTKVCPAVVQSTIGTHNPNAKCGACTMCAMANIDIVYPVHN